MKQPKTVREKTTIPSESHGMSSYDIALMDRMLRDIRNFLASENALPFFVAGVRKDGTLRAFLSGDNMPQAVRCVIAEAIRDFADEIERGDIPDRPKKDGE